jgi:hypothetical protein
MLLPDKFPSDASSGSENDADEQGQAENDTGIVLSWSINGKERLAAGDPGPGLAR